MSDDTNAGQVERAKPGATGADRDTLGRFIAGNSIGKLGGRPRGMDVRALYLRERADTVEQKWLKTIDTLFLLVDRDGNVAAAKLLHDILGEKDADKLDVNYNGLPLAELRQRVRQLVEDAFGEG